MRRRISSFVLLSFPCGPYAGPRLSVRPAGAKSTGLRTRTLRTGDSLPGQVVQWHRVSANCVPTAARQFRILTGFPDPELRGTIDFCFDPIRKPRTPRPDGNYSAEPGPEATAIPGDPYHRGMDFLNQVLSGLPLALGPSWLDPEQLIRTFGMIGILVIVFMESGMMVGFFLPGDSLLFTAGLLSAQGVLPDIWVLLVTIPIAAIAGDQTGYWIGRRYGPPLFNRPTAVSSKGSSSTRPRPSSRNTAQRRSSWPGSSRSCGPSYRSWRAPPT